MTETEIPTSETQEVLEPTIEDMIQAEDGVPFTTSLAIAQAFGKEHKNVLRDIQNLNVRPNFESSILSSRPTRRKPATVRSENIPPTVSPVTASLFSPWDSMAKKL